MTAEARAEVAVVGAGLWGSAAAAWLAEAGVRTVLAGPPEPARKDRHHGAFASHYDAARITRRLDPDPVWAGIACRAIDRYAAMEAEGGRPFFVAAGALMCSPAESDFLARTRATAAALGIACEALDSAALGRRFPMLAFPRGVAGLHEPTAGWIDPRAHLANRLEAFTRAGGRLVREEVTRLDETAGGVTLITRSGERVDADRALVACGAWTNAPGLLPRPLPLTVYARTVALVEVDADEARRLAAMPALVYRGPDGWDTYALPPVRYPDGRTCLKIGGDRADVTLDGPAAIGAWFRGGGNPAVAAALTGRLAALIPGLAIRTMRAEPCVTTFTPSGHPLAERVSDRITVLTGGNGAGAKGASELGRIGARLVAPERIGP